MVFLYPYPFAGINPAPWFHTGITGSRMWAVFPAKRYSSHGRTAVLWHALVLESVTSLECQEEADKSKDWDTAHSRGLFLIEFVFFLSTVAYCWFVISMSTEGILDIVFVFLNHMFFALKMLPKFSPPSWSASDTKAQRRLLFRHASHFVWERFVCFNTKQFSGMLLLSLCWCQTLPFCYPVFPQEHPSLHGFP